MPRSAGAQPYSYLHPQLGGPTSVSSLDPEPARPFGFGLSYTSFAHESLTVATPTVPTDGTIDVRVDVVNTGDRAGADVVQLYAHDPVASITRPVAQLLGYARVDLAPGERAVVHFAVPTTRLAFSGRDLVRAVEPGAIELWVGPTCAERETEAGVELVGERHVVTVADARVVAAGVRRA
jgi:beta-glucosidase